jgi:hypothetical protein
MGFFTLNKNTWLSIVLAVATLLIVVRVIPASVDPVLKLVISKNRTSIAHLHQPRVIETTKEVMVDVLNIAEHNRFKHPQLGEIGYGNDFFVDIEAPFTVKQTGRYRFIVASDDGFSLAINNRTICEFTGSRPLNKETCYIDLGEGTHKFKLAYYQGYGNAGLTVQYAKTGSNKTYWVGEDSPFINF